jgi:hypothetical protein
MSRADSRRPNLLADPLQGFEELLNNSVPLEQAQGGDWTLGDLGERDAHARHLVQAVQELQAHRFIIKGRLVVERYESRITKSPELRFSARLDNSVPEVRFERAV